MTFYSPLRYPGGKSRLSNYFKKIIEQNSIYECVYIEPYAGGASVALSLLFDGYVNKIIINDIDRSIYAFWHSVIYQTDELCDLIKKTPVTTEVWEKQKEIQKQKETSSLLELGFSTFFLNRTNRSGIINAGCIGGRKQKGKWKIDARFDKNILIDRIRKIALYKNRIKVLNLDAIKLIKLSHNHKKCLLYLDPPYYSKGKRLYVNFYKDLDHKNVAKEMKKATHSVWVMTYDNVRQIRILYKDYRQKVFVLNYSAGKTIKGKEVIIFSNNLKHINFPIISKN
jgi:DNA adenine methylase